MQPNIFDYMDIQHFLQDLFRQRKMADPTFSYGRWAQQLGFNNKTLLRLILQGKRKISAKTRLQFKVFLALEPLANEYFDVLTDYCQATSVSQKQILGLRLIQIQRRNFVQPEVSADLSLLQDAYGPIVLTLISSSQSALTAPEIEEKVCLASERVSLILKNLLQDGLIAHEDGHFRAVHSTFKINNHFGHQGLRNFYSHWLRQSVAAIDLPYELRRFRSLQILLSEDEFEDLNKSFQEFVLANLSRFERNTLENRRLYLMNSSLFPVTERL